MPQTYTPLPTGATPSLGTSGDAVKAYQTQLNTQNAGQAGYTPLVVDGKYGPVTQAASLYKAPAPADKTAGAIYSYDSGDSSALADARTQAADVASKQASGEPIVDEGRIRSDTLASFQTEIDAQNALYATKLSDARLAGAGRLGQNTAIEARRGMLGSDFGSAQTDTVTKGNQDIIDSINAEKEAAIQGILTNAKTAGDKAIADKTAAKTQGLDAYIKNLSDSATAKSTIAGNIANDMISKSTTSNPVDPNKMDPTVLNKIAVSAGVTPDAIKSAHASAKATADKAAADAAQKNEKTLGEGETLVDANGKVIAKGAPKTFAPTKLTQTEQAQATVDKVGTLFQPGYTIPNSGGTPFVDSNGYATVKGWQTAYRASGLPRQTFIKEFGYLLAPGLETKYGITGAELKIVNGVTPLPTLPTTTGQ